MPIMSTVEEKAIERMRKRNAAKQAELDRRLQDKIDALHSQISNYEYNYARDELKQSITRDLNNDSTLTSFQLSYKYSEYIEKYNLNFEQIYAEVIEDRKKEKEEQERKQKEQKKKSEKIRLKSEIDRILKEGKSLNRQEFDQVICSRNTFELIDYQEVSQSLLKNEYSNKLITKASGNESISIDTLILLGALLDISPEQVKADVEQKIRNEIEEKRQQKIKVVSTWCIWGIAAILLMLQVIFLQWWTILTGIITLIIVKYAFVIKNGIEKAPKENKKQMIWVQGFTWGIVVLLIILEIIFWSWWAILSGVATFVVAQFISLINIQKRCPKYDPIEIDILYFPSSFLVEILSLN